MAGMSNASLAATTTGLGLLVVFAVLIILIGIICLLSVVLKERKKKAKVKKQEAPVQNAAPVVQAAPEPKQEDASLIAVLAAAVASVLGSSPSGLVIKSYKRVGRSAWGKAGRDAQIQNKL